MRDRSMQGGTKLAREIQLTDWSTAGNLSNRSSGVQIPRDICTRFGRYLYSTKCSWIINVDTKIISKVLANRLEKVLPNLIHSNQNAFVKARSIFDAVRSIDDIVDYSKRNGWSGILVAIDFEKVFDTVNFNFLIRTLHKFNFGPSFI